MKTRNLVLLILLIPSVLFFLGGNCDSDGNGGDGSSFTYDGTTYQVSQGWLEYVGTGDGPHNFEFNMASSGVDIVAMTGIGDAVLIDIMSSTSPIAEGTYTYHGSGPPYAPNTFVDLWVIINHNLETDEGDHLGMAEAGTVTITEVSDSTISLNFDVTLDDGKTATGTWSGSVTML
jgi:hypothetical protein